MKMLELDFNSNLQSWLTCMVYCCHDKTNSKAKLQNIHHKINQFYQIKLTKTNYEASNFNRVILEISNYDVSK